MTCRVAAALVAASLALFLSSPVPVAAQAPSASAAVHQSEPAAMSHARGTFEVKLAPQPKDDYADGATLARLTIDKQFRGDLTGTSKGQMLSAGTPVKGSAGYVAIEQVTGTLAGRSGTFVFQHSGTMNRGAATLVLTVVPDSGTGELTGLTGSMAIDIANGKHSYDFQYALPGAP
jgi:hypothetical protein